MALDNNTPAALALKPAGEDQIKRAYEICADNVALKMRVQAFLATIPNRGQMLDFLEELKQGKADANLEETVVRICKALGIENPTSTEKLLALQIGMIQEQTSMLQMGMLRQSKQLKGVLNETRSNGILTALVGGTIFGTVLSK